MLHSPGVVRTLIGTPCGSHPAVSGTVNTRPGPVAQWLERRTHNPLVGGSNPSGPIPPVGRQLSRAGGGEDGLAEAFEDGRGLGRSLPGSVHADQQRLHLRHDPLLPGERGEKTSPVTDDLIRQVGLGAPLAQPKRN